MPLKLFCHPRGEPGLGLALNNKPCSDPEPGSAGFGAMPAFSDADISNEEPDAVIAYLDYLRERGPYDNAL